MVARGRTCLLLDCGFTLKETAARLGRLALTPTELTAIVVTHEHGDHIRGVGPLARKFGLPVWATSGTAQFLKREDADLDVHEFSPHQAFAIGDIALEPFPVPHDAREPCQFVFHDGDDRIGVLTDVGMSTPHIERSLSGCDALLLECNHDLDLLRASGYPPSLVARIESRFGHLDNRTAGGILRKLDTSRLQHLIALHLSEKNNTPALARAALSEAMGCAPDWIGVAGQDEGLGWRELRA